MLYIRLSPLAAERGGSIARTRGPRNLRAKDSRQEVCAEISQENNAKVCPAQSDRHGPTQNLWRGLEGDRHGWSPGNGRLAEQ